MTGKSNPRQSPWRDDAGNVTVELAFVLPVLVLLVLGAADFAMAFQEKLRLESAARAGGQMALFFGHQSSGTDMLNLVKARAREDYGDTSLAVTANFVCSCVDGTVLANCWEAECPGASGNEAVPIRTVTVTANSTHNLLFNWPGVGATLSLQGDAIMRVR